METGFCRPDHEEEEVGAAFQLRPEGWEVGSWREEPCGLPSNAELANLSTNGLGCTSWASILVMLGHGRVGSALKVLELYTVSLLKGSAGILRGA